MPHVIIKMFPGRTEEQKLRLAEAITNSVVSIAVCSEDSVSVSIEEIAPEDWAEKVHGPFIAGNESTLYKKTKNFSGQ
ncbi:MAG: tautomerase family protein [Syntrophaceae bacterium]|nr:tautomerase family protein [Syntrophaceae bacterium]